LQTFIDPQGIVFFCIFLGHNLLTSNHKR